MIAQRQRVAVEQVFAPKIRGVRNLLAALEGKALDFVLLCSSLSAVTGDFGQVDYCAANSFLDALASDETRRGKIPILSVNWDAWRGVGMAASQRLPDGVGIAPTQAGPLLERLLSDPLGARVLISTIDLDQQFVQARGPLANRLSSVLPTKQRAHPRPALQTIYVPPSDELEGRLLDLWEEFLGFSSIGVEDNFFELGGDSLLAIQLLAKVSHAYGVEIHPAAFFERPTIAALALLVEESLIEEIETEAVDPETAQRSSATV
jgi:acyl carrier protein